MDILGYVSAFLGGGFLTALLFVVGYSNKITTIAGNQVATQSDVKEIKVSLADHIKNTPCCQYHNDLTKEVAELKGQQGHGVTVR